MIYKNGYMAVGRIRSLKHPRNNLTKKKDIFIIKADLTKRPTLRGILSPGDFYFPDHFIGKRIRIKIELVQNNNLCQGTGCSTLVNDGATYCDTCFYTRLIK